MTNDEAMKLARRGLDDPTRFSVEDIDAICNHVLSGSMKREIENAAYERARETALEEAKNIAHRASLEFLHDGGGPNLQSAFLTVVARIDALKRQQPLAPVEDTFDKLEAILDNPPEPNEALKKLMQSPSVFAPPEGEPDLEELAAAVHYSYLSEADKRGWPVKPELAVSYPSLSDNAKELDRATVRAVLNRLGLAARPKVEDAEVANRCAQLRAISSPEASIERRAADLLERLAGERDQARQEVEQCHAKSTCCCGEYIRGHGTYPGHGPVSMYSYALDAAESQLAEREAELAKADAVIFALDHSLPANGPHVLEAINRHAARQQQKDTK